MTHIAATTPPTHGRIITVRPVASLTRVDVAVEDVEAQTGLAITSVRLASYPDAFADDADRLADDVAARLGFPVLVEVVS